jgi:hypothetical protein
VKANSEVKLIVIVLTVVLLSFTSAKKNLKDFCEHLLYEEMDTCTMILNNYFDDHHRTTPNEENYKIEVDSLITRLDKLECIDSCFYGGMMENQMPIMKTKPPMVDILIYHWQQSDTFKYILRVRFENPTKVVFLRRME